MFFVAKVVAWILKLLTDQTKAYTAYLPILKEKTIILNKNVYRYDGARRLDPYRKKSDWDVITGWLIDYFHLSTSDT